MAMIRFRHARHTAVPLGSVLLLSILAGAETFAQEPAKIFTQARRLETSEGKLAEACRDYARVVENRSGPRELRARALYRLALCHVKRNAMAEAREALARLLREFPASDPAVLARLMQAAIVQVAEGPTPSAGFVLRVQDLLVEATQTDTERQNAALARLRFFGEAALPVYRQALRHPHGSVRAVARRLLAELGDVSMLDELLRCVTGGPYHSPRIDDAVRALWLLCERSTAVRKRVLKAYRASTGPARYNLLRVALALGAGKYPSFYRRSLRHPDGRVRVLAWTAYAGSPEGKTPRFLEELLDVWSSHPKWHAALTPHLLGRGLELARKEPALLSRWVATLRQAIERREKVVLVKLIESTPEPEHLLLAADMAETVGPIDKAERWGPRLAGEPHPVLSWIRRLLSAHARKASPEELLRLADRALGRARRLAEDEQAIASRLRGLVVDEVARALPAEAFARLAEPLLARREITTGEARRLLRLDDPGQAILASSGNSPALSFEAKYLPLWIRHAEPAPSTEDLSWKALDRALDRPVSMPHLRMHTLRALQRMLSESTLFSDAPQAQWSRLSPEGRRAIRDLLLRNARHLDRGQDTEAWRKTPGAREVAGLLLDLTLKRPPVISLEGALTHVRYPPDISYTSYTPHDLVRERLDSLRFLLAAAQPSSRTTPFVGSLGRTSFISPTIARIAERHTAPRVWSTCVGLLREGRIHPDLALSVLDTLLHQRSTKLDRAVIDEDLRGLWPRATPALRRAIVIHLAETGKKKNVAFLERVIEPGLSLEVEAEIASRLAVWKGADPVPALLELLASSATQAKAVVCQALSLKPDLRAVDPLMKLLTHPNEAVRRAASAALEAIRNLEKEQEKWKEQLRALREWREKLRKQTRK